MELNRGFRAGWLWLSASVILVSCAQLTLKYAMQQLPGGEGMAPWFAMLRPENFLRIDLPVVIGLACYVISVVCWIGSLSRLPLSMAYPSLALSYLLVYFGAILLPVFNEAIDSTRLFGIGLIIFGVWLVSLPGKVSAG